MLALAQIGHVTVGHHGCDDHCVACDLVYAVAVQDVHSAQAGCRSVRSHIGYLDTKLAAALIDIEFTGLEDGLALGIVEVTE